MHVKSLRVKGFRSLQDMTISFEPGITTLVGENNTGKSSIALALMRLLDATTGNSSIAAADYPYSTPGPMEIEATVSLSDAETEEYLLAKLIPSNLSVPRSSRSPLHSWLGDGNNTVNLTLTIPSASPSTSLHWNGLYFVGGLISRSLDAVPTSEAWDSVARAFAEGGMGNETFQEKLEVSRLRFSYDMTNIFGRCVLERLKITSEFPSSPTPGLRSGVLETMSGAETASVLLNLKNHRNRSEKARYRQIIDTLKQFFPRYDVDAVEANPGGGTPEIQFSDIAHPERLLSISQMSAGVQQITSVITNLVAREGLILFIQHPETLLHPHAKRSLHALLAKASERNQIVVVTHDPFFIDPRSPDRLRRVWWGLEKGTRVFGVWADISDTKKAQIETALRHVGDREIAFARAVLLVEDESLYEFLLTVAPKLGYDLDAHGVSVRFTGGDGGHKPYHTILKALGVPHINFRDKTWGHNPNFPPNRFFSLGGEFEKYIDGLGLAKLRAEAPRGKSHRRGAAAVAALLDRERIPPIFDTVLKTTVELATGHLSDQANESKV